MAAPDEVHELVGGRSYTRLAHEATPERRADMRFIHTADWQLGMTRHFLNGDAQPRYSP
jgi:hypothetical protein